ncbi:hypothetical protein ACH5RR_004889 [Cinchona calisaya]|uniref:non-specific serine/threonine protein kinase n=1 Tax=Cinchona calisaya TaxID=153742 RepID=A0ABD3AZ86_9GENT
MAACVLVGFAASSSDTEFRYDDGFQSANLSLDGLAELTKNGLLMLTNNTQKDTGHAFHPNPIIFKKSLNGSAFSFSTTFIFAIRSQFTKDLSTEGLAFVIAPTKDLPRGLWMGFLGLFNKTNNGSASNHIFAVELDTFQDLNNRDINDNHVGIDMNNINSEKQEPAGYYVGKDGLFRNLTLKSGKPMQVWVEYDGDKKEINVTLAPLKAGKPTIPLLNMIYDLSPILKQSMYVGFSSASGPFKTNHYVLGWSFKVNGEAQNLDHSHLPKLPRLGPPPKFLTIGLPLICLLSILTVVLGGIYYARRQRKFAEVLEDWEVAYGPHRFKYKDLYAATKGFRDTELLGAGGFGKVYKGVMPTSKLAIAVKKVSHESRQGMREFVAEIVSIGRMRHRNIVPLLGYCRRQYELLLVYEYMPNGSLDRLLYNPQKFVLNWNQRFRIIKGVASGLFYLHQGWEQVVVHRDVKSSNVLLDGELNGRLGDFGLARLYDHGTNPQTTHVVGTVGYLAPEHYRTGKATTSSDVYAFGVFLLEVVCGKRPIDPQAPNGELILVERVFSCCKEGRILQAVDQNLGTNDFAKDEVELVLKLGLLCSHSEPAARPNMHQSMQYLEGSLPLPDLSVVGMSSSGLESAYGKGFEDVSMSSFPSSTARASSQYSYVADSFLSGGR